jgi:hypothetical protein
MATLRVSNLRGRSNGESPSLPDGVVVTGVTTTGSAIVGAAVTINATGVDAGAGIITATSFSGTVASSNLSGALPALDGSALTNLNIPSGFSELDAALFN